MSNNDSVEGMGGSELPETSASPIDPGTSSPSDPAAAPQETPPRRRRRWPWVVAVIVVLGLLGVAGLGYKWWSSGPAKESNYWQSLNEQGLDGEYLNKDIAVAQGKAYCDQVTAGQVTDGFWYQKTAVDFFCPEFGQSIKLVPTEKEQETSYLAALRKGDLGGQFPSDAAAVASGRAICTALESGEANKGTEVDILGVQSFCPEYAGGFRVIKDFTVSGSLTIIDFSDYPSIDQNFLDDSCEGSGGYSDVGPSSPVVVTNKNGDRLTDTTLGQGSGDTNMCEFNFSFSIPEGEEEYIVTFGDRGEFTYTESEIKVPDAISLSLGDLFD